MREHSKYDVQKLLLSSKIGMNNNGKRKSIVKVFKAVGWMNQNQGDESRDRAGQDHDAVETDRNCRSTTLSLLAKVLSADDDATQVLEWLDGGKIDAVHMAKAMPKTVEDLHMRETAPAQLLDGLKRAMNSQLIIRISGSEGEVGGLSPLPFEGRFIEFLADRLSRRTIPQFWCRSKEQEQWLVLAHTDFARDLTCRFESEGLDQLYANSMLLAYADIVPPIQAILSEVCMEWADRVDEALFSHQRRRGAFIFMCPTNTLSGESSIDMVRSIFQESDVDEKYHDYRFELDSKKKQLEQAIHTATTGAHEALNTCWECNTSGVQLHRCTGCLVAFYCSKNCQHRAFKSGHKKKCAVLKEKNEAFADSLEAVNRAHRTGKLEGIYLSITLDYSAASICFQIPHPYPEVILYTEDQESEENFGRRIVPGPSMKYFYQNFARVLRGEFWFYSNTVSMTTYLSQLGGRDDLDVFSSLVCCLCYDLFGFMHKDQMPGMFEHSLIKNLEDEFGVAMPAERFIEKYKSQASCYFRRLNTREKNERNRLRSNQKAEALLFFRKHFHK